MHNVDYEYMQRMNDNVNTNSKTLAMVAPRQELNHP
jgi:hypothetical protein